MGPTTNCVRVRVHVRAGADRATKAAELHRLKSMMATGRGATGSVRAADISFSLASMDKVCEALDPTPALSSTVLRYASARPLDLDVLPRELPPVASPALTPLRYLALAVAAHLSNVAGSKAWRRIAAQSRRTTVGPCPGASAWVRPFATAFEAGRLAQGLVAAALALRDAAVGSTMPELGDVCCLAAFRDSPLSGSLPRRKLPMRSMTDGVAATAAAAGVGDEFAGVLVAAAVPAAVGAAATAAVAVAPLTGTGTASTLLPAGAEAGAFGACAAGFGEAGMSTIPGVVPLITAERASLSERPDCAQFGPCAASARLAARRAKTDFIVAYR